MSNTQKNLLKEAKDAIQNKNFASALKLCKTILKNDKNCYMGLVFLGVSLQEVGPTDQASKAFKKAIQLEPNNPLGWTGLINYYEKLSSTDYKDDLIEAYISLLPIETNERKVTEYSEKLLSLLDTTCNEEVVNVIYNVSEKYQSSNNMNYLLNCLITYLSKLKDLSDNSSLIFEKAITKLLNDRNYQSSEHYASYLTLLHKQNKIDELIENAEKMFERFNSNSLPLLWLCKIYNQSYVEQSNLYLKIANKIDYYCTELLNLDKNNAMGLFTQGILLYETGKIMEAKSNLFNVTSNRAGLMHAWVFQAQICLKLNYYEEAFQSMLKADKLLKSINYSNLPLLNIVNILKIELLSKSKKEEDLHNALEIYKTIEDNSIREKCTKHLVDAYISLEKFDDANNLIKQMETINPTLYKFYTSRLLQKEKKFKEALQVLESENVNEAYWWMEIGLIQWNLDKKQSLAPLIKAAKCDPYNYEIFLHLGKLYSEFNDFEKARRCYEKATKINPKSEHAALELCKIYRKFEKWEDNVNFLESISNNSINKSNYWIWLQLGLTYLEQGNYDRAIDNLRLVIRVENQNVHCWESLADAYFARGAFTSAIKCYQIVLDLVPNVLYASLQIANIEKMLGEFAVARTKFEAILKDNKSYVPALKGLAETCMYQAKQCFNEQRLGTAKDHAQYAVEIISLAVQERNEFSCLWKILADSCLFVARLPDKYSFLSLSKTLLEGKHVEGNADLNKEDIFNFSVRCYCKSVSLLENNILLWHDLSACYFDYALYAKKVNLDNVEELFNYALVAAQHCTKNNPANFQHWNLLGTIAMLKNKPNYALAQHAFIQAVTVDYNSAIAWSNLGVLYLLMGDIKLANKAFGQGQRSNPDYVNSWIGQALIAEQMGSEEAMDLYRHSTQLRPHQQSALGYGHYVCQTLLDAEPNDVIYAIHNMHAVPLACDALTWYTEKNSYNSCAWNMLGILQERLGLNRNALKSFKNAFELNEKNYQDKIRTNYGRLLMKLEKYSDAIEIFRQVENTTANSGSGLALALFKDQQYEESYNVYEQSLNCLTENVTKQSDLLVGLASIAYMFQGPEVAKTLLFQSIQLKPPSPFGLFATLALILLHDDVKLAKLVLTEMESMKDDKEYLRHYGLLLSYVCLYKGEHKTAVIETSKLIHRHPDNPFLWLILSSLLIRLNEYRKPSMAAANSALLAMELGKASMDVTKVLCLVSLGFHIGGNEKQALIAAQKAAHCYPNIAEGWAVLAYILTVQNRSPDFSRQLLKRVQQMKPSTVLLEWTKSVIN